MRAHTASIPCALGRVASQSPASSDELRAMRAAAWHKQGIVVVPLDDIYDDWDRAFLTGIATKLYGARTTASRKSTPWAEGEVIDRGDGETWTVVATTAKSITVQRNRDGALATLAQLGEGRP
ncbi:hypothetical protein HND92_03330 [Diaphorobacter sp. JS3050]|uniref:hypothetical protein n=1 Tax=Diaphorobacter sp. JS3050 TaxID=2735554 RepID=UPI001551C121|nr:hypothetical protein [Diaphorobacter sp. JS3050]QJY32111.1 hypothetical protein HND92_03330 [Diaphorobacter sp. JS3050]